MGVGGWRPRQSCLPHGSWTANQVEEGAEVPVPPSETFPQGPISSEWLHSSKILHLPVTLRAGDKAFNLWIVGDV